MTMKQFFLLCAILLGLILYASAPPVKDLEKEDKEKKDKAKNFLKKFGYMKKDLDDDTTLKKALLKMQKFAGIEETGKLDDETSKLIKSKRCHHKDMDPEDESVTKRCKRYVVKSKWLTSNLSFYVNNFPTNSLNLDNLTIIDIFEVAFQKWVQYVPEKLDVHPAENISSAALKISFKSGDHGDNFPFDGPGMVLGHAFYPPAGVIHFDDDELWSYKSDEGTDLSWVATHEFGHALGLGHSNVKSSLMFPYYPGYKEIIILATDDVYGIEILYNSSK